MRQKKLQLNPLAFAAIAGANSTLCTEVISGNKVSVRAIIHKKERRVNPRSIFTQAAANRSRALGSLRKYSRQGGGGCLQKRTTKAGISRGFSNIHFRAVSYHPEATHSPQTVYGNREAAAACKKEHPKPESNREPGGRACT